jgi:hypothetical protein
MIQIDASAHCQLACPSCPTAAGSVSQNLGAGHLKVDEFQELLDRNPWIAEVELSNYGEMFLNPRLVDLLRSAFERKVVLHADNGVNLNFAGDEVLEALVRYQFRSMTCSIDGASGETYSQYRVKGDFERVIGHIRRINELKSAYRTGFPRLKWQFIVFGHNEHEISAARQLAGELDMDFFAKLSWDEALSPIRDRRLVEIQTASHALSREQHYHATGLDYARAICYQLWQAPVLNWDGRVTGCCRNFWGDFGANAFRDGLGQAIRSEKMEYARQMLMGAAPERADLPCATCDLYTTMKRDGRWLTKDEISRGPEGVLLSIVPEPQNPEVTHVDVFVTPGCEVNRMLFVRPPQAARFAVGRSFSVWVAAPAAGDYVVYALPKRIDPQFRKHYPALPPATAAISVTERPVAQEFRIVC